MSPTVSLAVYGCFVRILLLGDMITANCTSLYCFDALLMELQLEATTWQRVASIKVIGV